MYTILVIDDDEPIQIILENILSAEFNVLVANNAQEAIDVLSGNSVNLVLSDVYMPGINGIQLLESLRGDDEKKNIPVLIMTNLPSADKERKANELGAADFIDKTVLFRNKEEFMNRVRMKILTDVRVPDLNELLNTKKNEIIGYLMNEAVFGTFKTISNMLCKQLYDLFEVDLCTFWLIGDEGPRLVSSHIDSSLPEPSYGGEDLEKELNYRNLLQNKKPYFSNHIYNRDLGIMSEYSIENKLTAEIGMPLFSINEKALLLNNMHITDDASVFAFLNVKRKKLFPTNEYELLRNLIVQMGPAFWRLYNQN